MAKQNTKSKKGFTIIEVVLVLAIAGLIFLMVFIALPALQRSQRDTQRRDDMSRFLSQLNQYQANNSGRIPTVWKDFIGNYLKVGGDSFQDPSTGEDYSVTTTANSKCDKSRCPEGDDKMGTNVDNLNSDTEKGVIYLYTNAKCQGENPVYVQGDRKIAIRIKLEGAGIYCGNN